MGFFGGLGTGALTGYADALSKKHDQDYQEAKDQKTQAVNMLAQLVADPSTAPEHRAALLDQLTTAAHSPIVPGKPVKIELHKLPVIPGPSATVQPPSMNLPAVKFNPPGGAQNAQPNPDQPPVPIALPVDQSAQSLPSGQLPGGQPTQVSGPPVSTGDLKQYTPEEQFSNRVAAVSRRFPDKDQEEVAQFVQSGQWPKPDSGQVHTLAPGAIAINPTGKVLATNTNPSPTAKPAENKAEVTGGVYQGVRSTGPGYSKLISDPAQMNPEQLQIHNQHIEGHKALLDEKRQTELTLNQQRIAAENTRFQHTLDMQDLSAAKPELANMVKIGQKANQDLSQAQLRLAMVQRAAANPSGMNDSMLIGAAMGAESLAAGQKIRGSQAALDQIKLSRPYLAGAQVKFEHGFISGANLSQTQREQIVAEIQSNTDAVRQTATQANGLASQAKQKFSQLVQSKRGGKALPVAPSITQPTPLSTTPAAPTTTTPGQGFTFHPLGG